LRLPSSTQHQKTYDEKLAERAEIHAIQDAQRSKSAAWQVRLIIGGLVLGLVILIFCIPEVLKHPDWRALVFVTVAIGWGIVFFAGHRTINRILHEHFLD
jgi:hypothetical protein